jgi:F-type H+-transporting ATPase subunit gamma
LLTGTGKDQTHLLVIATAERGLCGGFNSSIVRMARDHADRLMAQGKTVKIFTVGKKGNDALKRNYGKYIIDAVDFRGLKQLAFFNAQPVGAKIISLFNEGQFVFARCSWEFKSVISQPTALHLFCSSGGGSA